MCRTIPSWAVVCLAIVTVGMLGGVPLAAQTAISAAGVVESTSGGYMFPDGSVQATAAVAVVASPAPVEHTGQQSCWDTDGDLLSCTGTGQDGEIQAGVNWPTPRFTDNLDGTVTDKLTGLIWLRDANCASISPDLWANALSAARSLSSGSCGLLDGSVAGDWRLPNIKELKSLLDYSQKGPALPQTHLFENVSTSFYWSSTSRGSTAWTIDMFPGDDDFISKTSSAFVWPVRAGSGQAAMVAINGLSKSLASAPLGESSKVAVFDGIVESTTGGFMFPDGSLQTTAAVAGAASQAPVEKTGQQSCWDTDGNLVTCIGTGQDGEIQAGVNWPTPRFTDNLDGTVTDKLTGLIWLRDANCASISPDLWANALSAARSLSSGSCGLLDGSVAGDWRLPNIKELKSLLDYSQIDPALQEANPFANVQRSPSALWDFYWSSTTIVTSGSAVWTIEMFVGNDDAWPKADTTIGYVWPVRGGQQD